MLDDIDGVNDAIAVQVPREGRYTRPMLVALWDQLRNLPGVLALFVTTTDRPNQVVRFSEILAVSGLDAVQQGNEHARISRVSKTLFGEGMWPIEKWQGSPGKNGEKAEMLYRAGSTVSEWWREIQANESAQTR
ncbi:hypothetical protein [Actinokineospora xionganensis]|uniref:Uncharacterized protein n=1 Tax=Actinokineospora xionganensis TaxID=2684470 RepID=A0ABR7LG29_9PSEU|nr:hypothetical protein [Actinokineospora xionganensis]MBC6451324.1 hypothetical protein [Actinokineospora xionganensis]